MSNRSDGLDFSVNVDGAPARRELKNVLDALAAVSRQATATGKAIDSSTVDAAKGYKDLAQTIAAAVRAEDDLKRSADNARAARERANTAAANTKTAKIKTQTAGTNDEVAKEKLQNAEINNRIALRQQENRDLETQSRITLNNDKAAEVAERRQYAAMTRESKARADENKRVEGAIAREQKAQEESVKGVQRELREEQKIAQAEADRARKMGEYQRASDARIAASEQKQLAAIRRVSRAEYDASVKKSQAGVRRNEDNIMNDIMASQNAGSIQNLNATRYALYDIATTAAIMGTAVAAAGVYASVTASKFEYAFASVQRAAELTGDSVGDVRGQLIALSETVPTTFEDISEIATLGAQMNINADSLDSFASTVSRFSATTNSAIDSTAQGFGRISNLLNVPTSQFENLGSSIAEVGVKSVATETEILSTTQQIAGAAAVYGFTADQVVGLGSAFASLAIAPEAARGSVTRIFGDIEQAVSGGTKDMEEYARILGVTSEEAITLWQSDPSSFFTQLVQGLSQSSTLLKDIQSINAMDVRDQNLLQRLAGSPDVLVQSLQIAGQAYQDGTYLSEAYAVQTDNLQSKLQVLANTFNSLAASAGGPLNEALKIGVDILTWFLQLIGDANPVILAVFAALSLLIGGFILLKAGQAATIAALLAMQTVLKNLGEQAVVTGINMASLNALWRQTVSGATGATTAVGAFSSQVKGAGVAMATFAKSTVVLAAISAALWLVSEAANAVGDAFASPLDKAKELFGDTSGLSDAIKEDTKLWQETGEAVATFSVKMDEASVATGGNKSAVDTWLASGEQAKDVVAGTADALDGQTIALGENADAWVRKTFAEQQGIQDFANDPGLVQAFTDIGGTIDQLMTETLAGTADEYINGLVAKAKAAQMELALEVTDGSPTAIQDQADAMAEYDQVISFLEGTLSGATNAVSALVDEQRVAANTASLLGTAEQGAGDEAVGMATDMDTLKTSVDNLFSGISTESDFFDSIQGLYSALQQSGNQFGTFDANGRAAFGALQGTILSTIQYGQTLGLSAQDSLLPLFLSLQQQGINTTQLLHSLAASPIMYQADIDVSALVTKLGAATGQSLGLSAQQTYLNQVMNDSAGYAQQAAGGISDMGQAAEETEEKVRTLTDYINDLSSVADSAFDFRYGYQDALDDVSSKWNKIAEDIADAKQEIRDYKAEMATLNAKKGTLETQLKVAIMYGDTTREAEIRAELGEVSNDLADAQTGMQEAQDKLSKSTDGNTDAAIKNRSELEDLAKSYQDLIIEYANAGHTQEEVEEYARQLKEQFEKQATQAGYSKASIDKYSVSFDDLGYAIRNVPKNITIRADINPAIRALDEFLAKAKDTGTKAGAGAAKNFGGGFAANRPRPDPIIVPVAYKMPSYEELMRMQQAIRDQTGDPNFRIGLGPGGQGGQVFGAATGGFVPGDTKPGSRQTDNQFYNLPGVGKIGLQGGEPIMTNAARDHYGDQMFRDINALKFKPQAAPHVSVQGGSFPDSIEVRLSSDDRALIAAGKVVTAVIAPSAIAGATSAVFDDSGRRGSN